MFGKSKSKSIHKNSSSIVFAHSLCPHLPVTDEWAMFFPPPGGIQFFPNIIIYSKQKKRKVTSYENSDELLLQSFTFF